MGRSRIRLTTVTLHNIGSISRARLDLERDLTVLVGLNGSGKSSAMIGLGLPGRIATEGLEATITAHPGGFARLHRLHARDPLTVRFEFSSTSSKGHYELAIGSARDGGVRIVDEQASWLGTEYTRDSLGLDATGSILDHGRRDQPGLRTVRNVVQGVQVYWGNLVNITDEFERGAPSPRLDVCSYNWASTVDRILAGPRAAELRQGLRHFTGDLVDLRITRSGGLPLPEVFRLSDTGSDRHQGSRGDWVALTFLSDGTVRVLDLLAVLLQDARFTLVGFEHPESDIHPGMAAMLVDYATEASRNSQVVFSTHSPDVLAAVEARSIRVVDKRAGATTVESLHPLQRRAVERRLFGIDELARIEGLRAAAGM